MSTDGYQDDYQPTPPPVEAVDGAKHQFYKMMAYQFHAVYEQLAPQFGYETRPDTKEFDPESPNGKLMVAVVCEVVEPDIRRLDERRKALVSELSAVKAENEKYREALEVYANQCDACRYDEEDHETNLANPQVCDEFQNAARSALDTKGGEVGA